MKRNESYVFSLWTVAWLCLVGAWFNLSASDIIISDNRYIITALTIEDGLPQNSVLCLIQTKEGYIWFGTQSGLVRYDSMAFRIYNRWNTEGLKNDRILSLYEDSEGALWVGTDGGGLARLKLKEGDWRTYTTNQGLSNNTIRVITADSRNNLWIGTDYGLNYLNVREGKIKTYTVEDGLSGYSVTALALSPDGDDTLWIGTRGNGLNCLKNNKFLSFPAKNSLSSSAITALHHDRSGSLWIGTDNGLYHLVNDDTQTHRSLTLISENSIRTILEDSYNNLWIGTDGDGLFCYQAHTDMLTSITTRQGFPDDFIYSLLEDQEGNLWIGTVTTGLVRLKHTRLGSITTVNGLPENRIHAILQDNLGYLWVGTQRNGLSKIKLEDTTGTVIHTYTTAEGLPGNQVRALCLDKKKSLWIGTQGGGLAHLENNSFQVYTRNDGLSSNEITTIFQDQAGNLWVGTVRGLNQRKNGIFTTYRQIPALVNAHIRTIGTGQQENLLVGTRHGLFSLNDGNSQSFAIDYDILALYEDNQTNLWIGTNGNGLIRFKQKNPALPTVFTTDNGLPNNYIFSITEDGLGNLWMSSYRGVFRVSKQELNDFADHKIPGSEVITVVSFDEKEGMQSSECVKEGNPSACKSLEQDKKSKLFIPTIKGIAVFDLNITQSGVKSRAPSVIIEDVIVDNRSFINISSPPLLPPGTQVVEFYFNTLSFTAPDKVRLLYKLDGFDTRWIESTLQQKRRTFYLNLPPGNYSFNVKACNYNGVWNHEGARFEFKINDHFYRRPLFYLLIFLGLAIFIGGISWYLNRYKQNKIKTESQEIKKEKYKTSALLPETVAQVLPRLKQLMDEEKVFLDPDLSLQKLSQQIHVHYNHLSQIINKHMGKSFNDYINSYRIEEAKKILSDPIQSQKTILEIAYDIGFYSKSVFNTAFKKFTGMTPSQYKKKVESKKGPK